MSKPALSLKERIASYREEALNAWLSQDNWKSDADRDLMRSILARDADGVSAALEAGADITVRPPAYSKRTEFFSAEGLGMDSSPWLAYALEIRHADPAVVGTLLAAGADPLEKTVNEDATVLVLYALMNHAHPQILSVFQDALPAMSATFPADADGYGPLAYALLNRYERPLLDNKGVVDVGHQARVEVARSLLAIDSAWDDRTRRAALEAASGSSCVVLLDELEQAGCRVEDASEADRALIKQNVEMLSGVFPDQKERWNGWRQVLGGIDAAPKPRRMGA